MGRLAGTRARLIGRGEDRIPDIELNDRRTQRKEKGCTTCTRLPPSVIYWPSATAQKAHMVEPAIQGLPDEFGELMAATAAGDRRAFARLYEETSGRIFAIVLRLMGDRPAAEEILQETYLTVWRKSDQYRPDRGAPLAWMTTIARNKAIDRLRADAGRVRNLDEWDDRIEKRISRIAEQDAVPKHLSDTVRRCIGSLQVNYRKSLLLAYYYGMSHEELATVLDSPLGTVKSWVRRGLSQLKECVDQ